MCIRDRSLAAEQQLNACYTLMTLSLSEGDFEAALDYADQCLEMDELLDDALRADIYLKQGYALLYLQRTEEAQTALDACLELLPGAADAMLLKLQACAAMGEDVYKRQASSPARWPSPWAFT